MDDLANQTIKFRCPPELAGLLPRPTPGLLGLPDWFKAMPHVAFSSLLQEEQMTVKKCPPFIDAMTCGFLMPLAAELRVENGTFAWDHDGPVSPLTTFQRAPIDFHDNNQVVGTPFFDKDSFLIKFINFWTIELPPGYSLFVTHPVNRQDLPFHTLTGLVDADRYKDNFVHFPAQWRDPNFSGTLPKGTPIAQCLPFKRDIWDPQFEIIEGDAAERQMELTAAIVHEKGIYRRRYRAPKR